MAGMFDDIDEDKEEMMEDSEENTLNQAETIRNILDANDMVYEELSDREYDTVLLLKNGVAFVFDDEGVMMDVVKNYTEE